MLTATGLYGHIRNNNIKSALLLAGFVVLVGVMWLAITLIWSAIADRFEPIIMGLDFDHKLSHVDLADATLDHWLHRSLVYSFIPILAVGGWFAFAFFAHRELIRQATGAQGLSRMLDPRLYNLVENLTILRGLPMPRLEVIETTALNAYASGFSPQHSTIAVTRGLIDTLNDAELEAVLAHEVTHIRNRDVRLMMVATIFVGILSYVSQVMRRQTSPDGALSRVIAIADFMVVALAVAMSMLANLFGVLAHFALSRSRELLADAGAVELTKDPDALIAALRRIEGHDKIEDLPPMMEAMMISSRIDGLYATHPTIAERVEALQLYAGARRDKARVAAHRRKPARVDLSRDLVQEAIAPGVRSFGKRKPR